MGVDFPMSLNAFYVIVLRTFFRGIPLEIIEAAHIDGAGEFRTFLQVVLPLSKPGVATIGLFTVIAYWNDWFLGMLYIFETENIQFRHSCKACRTVWRHLANHQLMHWNMHRWLKMLRQTADVWH